MAGFSFVHFSVALATFAAAVPLFAATPVHDQILVYQTNGILVKAVLPAGPANPAATAAIAITSLLALPSGQVLATTIPPPHPGHIRSTLNELLPDGSLRVIRGIDFPPDLPRFDRVEDMAIDHRGRVYAMIYSFEPTQMRLAELDPATGETLGSVAIGLDTDAIATAPDGLWAVTAGNLLRKLDPESGEVGDPVLEIAEGDVAEMETDSAGRLWYLSQRGCSPLCQSMGSIDLATGVATPAPSLFYDQTPAVETLTIARRCSESSTVRCLQGGRFRAEVAYEAYDGASGQARVTPARSRDTGIFSFFDPDNWELMVKVLDGCALNENFWVYSAASTDVEYHMTITDTQTGAQKTYQNPLGQIALTVTDNTAFPCSP